MISIGAVTASFGIHISIIIPYSKTNHWKNIKCKRSAV